MPRWMTLVALMAMGSAQSDPVTLVIVNGHVYTADGQGTVAEAVAVRGNRIAAVGTTADISELAGEKTTVVDARGGSVLPGFQDSHIHFLSGGLSLDEANLLDASTF